MHYYQPTLDSWLTLRDLRSLLATTRCLLTGPSQRRLGCSHAMYGLAVGITLHADLSSQERDASCVMTFKHFFSYVQSHCSCLRSTQKVQLLTESVSTYQSYQRQLWKEFGYIPHAGYRMRSVLSASLSFVSDLIVIENLSL